MYTFLLSEFIRLSKFELKRELPQTTDQSKVVTSCPDSDIGSLALTYLSLSNDACERETDRLKRYIFSFTIGSCYHLGARLCLTYSMCIISMHCTRRSIYIYIYRPVPKLSLSLLKGIKEKEKEF